MKNMSRNFLKVLSFLYFFVIIFKKEVETMEDKKTKIRKENKILRSKLTKDEVREKSERASKIFLQSDIYKKSRELMLYMPLGNESDTKAIIEKAFFDGKKVIFPVTDEKSGIITPYYSKEDTEFSKGGFSVFEPLGCEIANEKNIDVIIVPGIAFSKNGARIGFGKGCYDKLLKNTDAIKIGYCYSFQLYEEIPTDTYDIPMDYIISEDGMIKCN